MIEEKDNTMEKEIFFKKIEKIIDEADLTRPTIIRLLELAEFSLKESELKKRVERGI